MLLAVITRSCLEYISEGGGLADIIFQYFLKEILTNFLEFFLTAINISFVVKEKKHFAMRTNLTKNLRSECCCMEENGVIINARCKR